MAVIAHGAPTSRLKSISWKEGPGAEACCRRHLEAYGGLGNEFGYLFCLAICTMCCDSVEMEIDMSMGGVGGIGGGNVPGSEQPSDLPTDIPTSTAQDSELSFTTSVYGAVIPIVFGSDKLTGNVIWASPIKRNSVTVSGQPYYYSTVSFALGLCEGEINGVLRQWVGDKLIFNNTLDTDVNDIAQPSPSGYVSAFQVDLTDPTSPLRNITSVDRRTKITVFNGSETQIPQGVIVDAEGYENTPAYRGLAYVLFENFIVPSSAIPNLFVEVTANTESKYPRIYGDLETTDVLDDLQTYALLVDPAYDQVTVVANGPDGATGFVTFDYNRLEELVIGEVKNAEEVGTAKWSNSWTLPNGMILFSQDVGNQGVTYVYNPFTGTIMDKLGPGGGLISHSLDNGFAALGNGNCVFSGFDSKGFPAAIFAGIGFVNKSIGFCEITETGQLKMRSTLNAAITKVNGQCEALQISASTASAHPVFSDNQATEGAWIYVFSHADSEKTSFSVQRVDVSDVANPMIADVTTLSVGLFNGEGFGHSIYRVMVDPADNCFLLWVACDDISRPTRLAKWNPFTDRVVWNTALSAQPSSLQGTNGGELAAIPNSKWAYIDSAGDLYTVDLITGAQELLVDSVGTQNLPPTTGARQFYNGYENSLIYQSTVASKKLTKVFIDRLTRSTVELSSIVTNLLRRQGVVPTDIAVEDLTSLTLNGYTISAVKSLRQAFGELGQAFKYDVVESNGKFKFKTRGASAVETFNHRHVAANGDNGWLGTSQENPAERPRKLNLTYRDIDREYAQNVQSVQLAKTSKQVYDNEAAIDVDVPIVLDAVTAAKLAEVLYYAESVGDRTYDLTLPPRARYLDPADVIKITMPDGSEISMRLREMTIGTDRSVKVDAAEEDPDIYNDQVNIFGNVGRFERDGMPEVTPRVDPVVLSLPFRTEEEALDAGDQNYLMYIAWLNLRDNAVVPTRSATLMLDGTTRITLEPPTNFPTWGYIIEPPLAPTNFNSTDYGSVIRVRLVSNDGLALESAASYADLFTVGTVNLAYVGGELIQFQTVTEVSENVYDITVLKRGKNGTDTQIGTQNKGDRFILLGDKDGILDTGGITQLKIQTGGAPRRVAQIFVQTGSPFQSAPIANFIPLNLRPWVPTHLQMAYDGTDAEISWVRRSRIDGEWADDGLEEVLVNEATESYTLFLFKDKDAFVPLQEGTYLRKVDVNTPNFTYTAAMQTADGFNRTTEPLYAFVYQTGSHTGVDNGAATHATLPHV